MRRFLSSEQARAICLSAVGLGAVDARASRVCVKRGDNTVRLHFREDGRIDERLVDQQGRLLAMRRYIDIEQFAQLNEVDAE